MGMTAISCILPQYGIGRHIGAIPGPPPLNQISKLTFSGQMIYQFVLTLPRLALCIFYLNIFQDKWSKRVFYALIGFTSIGFIAVEFATFFRCSPIHLAWTLAEVGYALFPQTDNSFHTFLCSRLFPCHFRGHQLYFSWISFVMLLWKFSLHCFTAVSQSPSLTSGHRIESKEPATIPSQYTSQPCYTTSSATSSS